MPARQAEPTGSSGRAGTHPRHCGLGRTTAQHHDTTVALCAGGERGALRLGTSTACGTATTTAPRHGHCPGAGRRGASEEELACPNDPLNFNTSVIQLFGKEVHALHGVFTSVRVDVRPPGWYFNCRKAGNAQRAHEKGLAELLPACPRNTLAGYPSPGLLEGLTCHLFISKAKGLTLRLLGNFLWD